jgi:hypothetical protein
MRNEYERGTLVEQTLQRREGSFDAGIVLDFSAIQRDIEVDADDSPFSRNVDTVQRSQWHMHFSWSLTTA